jgi:hypothetical protein
MKKQNLLCTVIVCLLLTFPVGAAPKAPANPNASISEQIMELNRSGKWGEAAYMAQQFLDSHQIVSADEICQAYYHLIYASARLGDLTVARETLERFDQQCTDLPATLSWLPIEIDKLRVELEEEKVAPKTRDDGFWQTEDPASLGVDPQILAEHQTICEDTGADACMVVYKGKIIQEWYSSRYRVPMPAMSCTKSVTGLLTGMLVDEEKIESIDTPVCDYIQEWCEGEKGEVTLHHLLSMTSGLKRRWEDGVPSVNDKNPFVITLPLSYKPGTHWAYSNEGVQLLSPILDKAAGEPIQDYARKRLFEPLGMRDTRLRVDQAGHAWTYAAMETTLRDFARLGLLMLNRGTWGGQQIISEDWIQLSTSPSQELFSGYGFLWWLDTPNGFRADGYLDTNLYVFPEYELVVARMQRSPSGLPDEGNYEPLAAHLLTQLIQTFVPEH